MDLKQAIEQYNKIIEKIQAYDYADSLANWDINTLAPKEGKVQAAKYLGILAGEKFQLKVSPELSQALDVMRTHEGELTDVMRREIELFDDEIGQLKKIPKEEYQEYTEAGATSQIVWEEAKEKSDYDLFMPYLDKMIQFNKRFAKLTKPEMNTYDACLDNYEKGMTVQDLDVFFDALRKESVPLIQRIQKDGRPIRDDFNSKFYPVEMQQKLSLKLLECVGFDMNSGVLAASEHPFTTEINSGDIRLTTHYYEKNLNAAILSTIHEAGHGLYDQHAKKSPIVAGSTLDVGVSMGIHESQSRFYENFICRSQGFWEYFYPVLQDTFKDQLADVSADEYYRSINIAKPDMIRIEADELTYNLHIMVRYELEKGLMDGSIDLKELPKLWNEKYEEYLGITPRNNKEGVLQDVHWSWGEFGYFPSYALGNAYAAQFLNTMKKSIPFDELCRKGDLNQIGSWLNENIHQYGSLKKPGQLLLDITGEKLNPVYLTNYLKEKFEKIYF